MLSDKGAKVMLGIICFVGAGVIMWYILNNKRPIAIFMGVVALRGDLAVSGWLLGEDLKGVCLFLLVSGSLMSIFGFLLCLIP